MNIESKIAELDAQIEDRTQTKDALGSDSDAKEKIYKHALHEWAVVYNEIEELKTKRKLLAELQKECECVISRGVPVVQDEDIGRTAPLNGAQFNGSSLRVPIFKDDQEREFIEPKE